MGTFSLSSKKTSQHSVDDDDVCECGKTVLLKNETDVRANSGREVPGGCSTTEVRWICLSSGRNQVEVNMQHTVNVSLIVERINLSTHWPMRGGLYGQRDSPGHPRPSARAARIYRRISSM